MGDKKVHTFPKKVNSSATGVRTSYYDVAFLVRKQLLSKDSYPDRLIDRYVVQK